MVTYISYKILGVFRKLPQFYRAIVSKTQNTKLNEVANPENGKIVTNSPKYSAILVVWSKSFPEFQVSDISGIRMPRMKGTGFLKRATNAISSGFSFRMVSG